MKLRITNGRYRLFLPAFSVGFHDTRDTIRVSFIIRIQSKTQFSVNLITPSYLLIIIGHISFI